MSAPLVPPAAGLPASIGARPVLPMLGGARASSAPAELKGKLARLRASFREKGSVLVAYSGGVDSSLVAKVAFEELGYRALAVIAVSPTLAADELIQARTTARAIGIRLEEVPHSEFENPEWVRNDGMRCYHCKKDLTLRLAPLARERGFAAVAYGIVTDDLADHRPGVAATREEGAWHPLVEAGLSKADVRAAARKLGLPVWNKPAAPCLSSRVAYGEPITEAKLSRIERAEAALRGMGFLELRVRSHGDLARIEVSVARMPETVAHGSAIVKALREAGFTYVTLDLAGFRSGSMNEALGSATRRGAAPGS